MENENHSRDRKIQNRLSHQVPHTQSFVHSDRFARMSQEKPADALATTQDLVLQQVAPDVLRYDRALGDPCRYVREVSQQLQRAVLAGDLF